MLGFAHAFLNARIALIFPTFHLGRLEHFELSLQGRELAQDELVLGRLGAGGKKGDGEHVCIGRAWSCACIGWWRCDQRGLPYFGS